MHGDKFAVASFLQINSHYCKTQEERSPNLENASTYLQDFSVHGEVEESHKKLVDPNDHFPLPSRDLLRLNDTFQSCGLRSLPRDANVQDVVYGSIQAINELVSRARTQTLPFQNTPKIAGSRSSPSTENEEKLCQSERALDKLSVRCENLSSENKELRKLVMQWKSEVNSIKHLLTAKEKEVGKLRSSLKEKTSEDDKRAALSMTTIRDQNMPHSSLLLLNQMQKRISDLEQENTTLAKQNTRLRHLDRNKQNEDELKRALKENELLVSQLDHSKAQLSEMENKYYSIVEERNSLNKIANKETEFILQITRVLGEDQKQALKTIMDMQRIVTDIFPPIDSFVTRVTRMVDPGHSGPITQPVLTLALDRVIQWAQDSGEYSALMEAKYSGPLTEQERLELIRLRSLQHCAQSTFGLHETHSDSLIPYLGRVKFKLDEFRNFYKQACMELGMTDKIPSYVSFVTELKKQLGREGEEGKINVSGLRSAVKKSRVPRRR